MPQSSDLRAEAHESARLRQLDLEIEAIRALLRPQEELDALRAEVARARKLLAGCRDVSSAAEVDASGSQEPRDPWQAAVELARKNPEPTSLVFDSAAKQRLRTATATAAGCSAESCQSLSAAPDSNVIKASPASKDPWQAAADLASMNHGPVSVVFDSVSQATAAETSVSEVVPQENLASERAAASASSRDPWQAAVEFASMDREPVSLVFDSAGLVATGARVLKAVSKAQAPPPCSVASADCTTINSDAPRDPWQAAVDFARKSAGPASLVFDSGSPTHQGHQVLRVAFQDTASETLPSMAAKATSSEQVLTKVAEAGGLPDLQQQAKLHAAGVQARRQKRRLQQLDAIAGQLHSQLRQRRGGSGTTTPAWVTQSPASADAAASFRGSPATGGSSSVGTAAWSMASSAELLRREKVGKQLESQVKALARRFQALRDLR